MGPEDANTEDDRKSLGRGAGTPMSMAAVLAEADDLHERSCELLEEARLTATHPRARRGTYRHLSPVALQKVCANRKIAPQRQELAASGRTRNVPLGPFACSTYVSVSSTCPASCTFKDAGCYAQTGSYGWKIRRLDAAARSMAPMDVMAAEADAIDRLYVRGVPQDGAAGGRDLRLHISGEVSCERGALLLAEACRRFQTRGGGSCWTYTHRWREVPEEAWDPIRALASVETAHELEEAVGAAYVPALTVRAFASSRPFTLPDCAVRVMPCRAEIAGATCVQCRLCLEPGALPSGTAVGFALHGMGAAVAAERLSALEATL